MAAILLLAATIPAAAEFAVVEETEAMTVYRDGNQVIVLTDAVRRSEIRRLAETRAPERLAGSMFRSQLSGKDRIYLFLVRTRFLDDEAICEKFATRPQSKEDQRVLLHVLGLAPCGAAF